MPVSALFLPLFFSLSHSLTLSAQAGSGRTEMAFWVTQAGYAICRVNWRKRIEKEVETNDDGLAMIVPCPFSLSPAVFSPRGHWSPNNVATMPKGVEMFFTVLVFFLICNTAFSYFVFFHYFLHTSDLFLHRQNACVYYLSMKSLLE